MRSLERKTSLELMRDGMDEKLFPGLSKLELIDACMTALREQENGPQDQAGTSRRESADVTEPADPAVGSFDEMRPFFPSCGRQDSLALDAQEYGVGPQKISSLECSGEEGFAANLLPPMEANSYSWGEQGDAAEWNEQSGNFPASFHPLSQGRRVAGNNNNATAKCNTRALEVPQARCSNRVGRRFLSAETMDSTSSQCQYKRAGGDYGSHRSLNYIGDRDSARESAPCGSNYDFSRGNKEIARNVDGENRVSKAEIERFRKRDMSPSSGVLTEIDMAVSMAQSRFTVDAFSPVNHSVSFASTPKEITRNFSSCDRDFAHGDQSSPILNTISSAPVYPADVSPTTTKDYASRYSCSISDKWKRKSFCQSTSAPIHKPNQTFGQAQIEDFNIASGECDTIDRGGIYQPSGSAFERRFSGASATLESAVSSVGTLQQSVESKINSVNDERSTSYATSSSPLHVQSSSAKPQWPQVHVREEQVSRQQDVRLLPQREVKDKPVNLCLQQSRSSADNFLHKSSKTPEFRRYTKSFTVRQKPYQHQKRRTKSQCSPNNISPVAPTDFLVNDGACLSDQVATFDMVGAANRTDLENFKNTTFVGGQGSSGDANLGSLFATCQASHMMVQDDMKTYAVLSGRPSEDIMNPQELSGSSSTPQQQQLFHPARHSHSIINYAGPHGQSTDLRTTDLSPSPPVRDMRTSASASLPGIIPQPKGYSNVIVAHRQHHSPSPSHQEDYQAQEHFQRQFDPQSIFEMQESRQLHHHHHQQSPLAQVHRPGTSFAPLLSPQQQHHQQASQYLAKQQQQRREYFENISSHSGLAVGSMSQFTGTLQPSQIPHGTYLKPPPVDLDDLSEDERERMRVKRERNRVAAAKCRNRRRELLERLEKEAEQLEREQELLRENVRRLRVQKIQLGNMLEEHEPTCSKTLVEEEDKKPATEEETSTSKDELKMPNTKEQGEKNESPAANAPSPLQLTTQA